MHASHRITMANRFVMLDTYQVLVSISALPLCPLTWNNMNSVAYKWQFFSYMDKTILQSCVTFPQRISVGTQFLLLSFSISLFISRVQKRIQYPRNSHYSVSVRILTAEKLLKSLIFMGKNLSSSLIASKAVGILDY